MRLQTNQGFDHDRDRLALVTLRGTDTLLNTFNSLLDCARASANGADFAGRVAYLSKKAQGHSATIRSIIQDAEGQAPTDDDYWRFLRILRIVSFDLNTSSAQTEAWVKTLLAHSSHEPDPIAAAETTWRELLELVGFGMPTATSYTYADLPKALRNRHGVAAHGGGLSALEAHSQTTLNGIQATIAHTASISRNALVARVLEDLDQSQVVVLTGPTGLGKSALARAAIELWHGDLFCLAFRAEEFATSHIDHTLQQAQASINAERLLALLAAQGRKVILVDSVERLLEASVRDAFSDLLRFATQERSIQLLLTCRDYSLDTVRASLLEPAGLPHSVLEVPPFTDDELAQVVKAVPSVEGAVRSESLRRLLRSPYFLNLAAQMDWSDPRTQHADERIFRSRCWHEFVRREVAASDGMPRRRDQVFMELAGRRARALSPYVRCDDLDVEALETLRRDDLVVFRGIRPTLLRQHTMFWKTGRSSNGLADSFPLAKRTQRRSRTILGGTPLSAGATGSGCVKCWSAKHNGRTRLYSRLSGTSRFPPISGTIRWLLLSCRRLPQAFLPVNARRCLQTKDACSSESSISSALRAKHHRAGSPGP